MDFKKIITEILDNLKKNEITLSTEFNTLSNKPTFLFSIFTFPNYIAP